LTTAWKTEHFTSAILLIGGVLVVYLCFRVFQPFLGPTVWATVLAVLLHPLFQPSAAFLRSRSLAAVLLCLLGTLALGLPCYYLVSEIPSQIGEAYEKVEAALRLDPAAQGPDPRLLRAWEWMVAVVARAGYQLPAALSQFLPQALTRFLGSMPALIGGAVGFLFDFVLTFLTLFFFLRDGEKLLHWLRGLVPLGAEQTDELFRKIRDVVSATVFGGLAVALAQGLLGGVLFWLLGLPTPLLWGLVMGLLSLLPPLGAWLVWVPAGGILIWQGYVIRAAFLFAGGVFGISMIDNILRPLIIGQRTQLPALLIFLSLAGGLQALGPVGLIAGPVLVALLIGILDFLRARLQPAPAASSIAS